MNWILERLSKEGAVIADAPLTFGVAVLAAAIVVWLLFRHQIANLKSSIQFRDDQIADYRTKLDGATPDEARARIERLEARIQQLEAIAPRTLSHQQLEAVTEEARRAPGRILVTYDLAASDGISLQSQFLQAFRKAGWTASGNFMAGGDEPYDHEFALNLPDKETKASQAARAALEAAHVRFVNGQAGDSNHSVDAEIVIFARIA
jgi:hypothetical protein